MNLTPKLIKHNGSKTTSRVHQQGLINKTQFFEEIYPIKNFTIQITSKKYNQLVQFKHQHHI